MEVRDISVDALVPNPENINQMDDRTLAALVGEIKEVGMISPINVVPSVDGKYIILGGEHRWKASKIAGLTTVPCVVLTDEKWQDKDLFDLVSFRLNVLKGSQNPEKFMHLYQRVASRYGAEKIQDIFAVTDEQLWKKLTKSVAKGLKKAGVKDVDLGQVDSAEKFSKQMAKVLSKHIDSSDGSFGSIVVSMGKKSIVIKADEVVFSFFDALHNRSVAEKRDINELIKEMMLPTR